MATIPLLIATNWGLIIPLVIVKVFIGSNDVMWGLV